jgi:hypothetical protein
MPFESFMSRFIGHKEIVSLTDFQERLDNLISSLEKEYKNSTAAEYEFKQKYDEKLSKLDFSGSKHVVEDSRRQLVKSLEINVQLDFLKNIRDLSNKIPYSSFQNSQQLSNFRQVAMTVFDHKKISSQVGRHFILKKFEKLIPSTSVDSAMAAARNDETVDIDVQKILKEVEEGIKDDSTIDKEVEKIINEIRRKKEFE